MRTLVWRAGARQDLVEIITYVAVRNPSAARRLRRLIEEAVLPLRTHPYAYRAGRVPGTPELVAHPNYILVYRVTAEHIEVVSMLHARQQYP